MAALHSTMHFAYMQRKHACADHAAVRCDATIDGTALVTSAYKSTIQALRNCVLLRMSDANSGNVCL